MTPRKIWPAALLLLLCACRNNPPAASRYILFPGGNIQLKLAYQSGVANTTNIGSLIVQTKK